MTKGTIDTAIDRRVLVDGLVYESATAKIDRSALLATLSDHVASLRRRREVGVITYTTRSSDVTVTGQELSCRQQIAH